MVCYSQHTIKLIVLGETYQPMHAKTGATTHIHYTIYSFISTHGIASHFTNYYEFLPVFDTSASTSAD